MTALKMTATEALEKYFGYHQFRPLQADIIDRICDNHDTVVIMPTGGGKSICYQIPAIIQDGLGIVISPLIALMKDQVEGLVAAGIHAAFLNSSISVQEQKQVIEDAKNGKLDLLYLSPEKLLSQDFQAVLPALNINLFAIDEAHCISSWGHDFRPEYRQLVLLKKRFPDIPVVALTATADKATRKDIGKQLGLESPKIFLASFDRPNLSLEVRPGRKKWQQIVEFVLKRKDDSGIVYCNSRKGTEALAEKLNEHGIHAGFYHAGLTDVERNRVQEAFINDQIPVICATIAFGMGIDKSNIRWVIHHNLPKNMESFYQEIGRAGRDGADADTMLFFSVSDIIFYERIMSDGPPDYVELQRNKLKRLEDYARAATCRRKILLSYFGEYLEKDCGNCDVCKSPPATFEGTTIAQMALSAVYRMRETAGIQTLIDVLRGSRKREVIQRGYDKIKTYGAGKAYSNDDWLVYIGQLIHQGLLELAFDDNYALKLTAVSNEVLFENKTVKLVQPATVEERQAAQDSVTVKTAETLIDFDDALFQKLKAVRMELSKKYSVPPYIIFHDKTLQEMAAVRPTEKAHFYYVNGVGETKKDRYGASFLEAIKAYGAENGIDEAALFTAPEQLKFVQTKPKRSRKGTVEQSVKLFKTGMDLEEIATERGLVPSTILSHLLKAYYKGEELSLERLIDASSLQRIQKGMIDMGEPFSMKRLFEHFEGEIAYPELKLAVAILQKEVIKDG